MSKPPAFRLPPPFDALILKPVLSEDGEIFDLIPTLNWADFGCTEGD
jgi:hypothetical protein